MLWLTKPCITTNLVNVAQISRFRHSMAEIASNFPSLRCTILPKRYFAPIGAETLTTVQIRAVPFISAYKIPAIITVVILFIIEIICDVLRIAGKGIRLNPIYISAAICAIISIILIVCYVSCAIGIATKLSGKMGNRRNQVWTMSIRIAISSLGYTIVVVSMICLGVFLQRVWGRPMTFNAIFVGLNLSSIMQVIALQPISRRGPRSSKSKAKQDSHDRHSSAARTS